MTLLICTMHPTFHGLASHCSKFNLQQFVPEKEDNDFKKPVKVFILMGGANMVGAGQIHGNVDGALDYTVKRKHRFIHLTDVNMEWRQNPRVKYVSVHNEFEVYRDEWLGVKEAEAFFGPELQFGYGKICKRSC